MRQVATHFDPAVGGWRELLPILHAVGTTLQKLFSSPWIFLGQVDKYQPLRQAPRHICFGKHSC